MVKTNQPENSVAAPATQRVVTGVTEKKDRPVTFVVVREGFRVSDREYSDSKDPAAIVERDFWKRVATNHSYGEPVGIVQYDSKKHRVW